MLDDDQTGVVKATVQNLRIAKGMFNAVGRRIQLKAVGIGAGHFAPCGNNLLETTFLIIAERKWFVDIVSRTLLLD
ncbi:MAG: hypothetical protein IPN64_00775 [Propionivibrio sp.]|uniref:hypothetical protein n=1 Tax=Propionivibrio sp. TaxID=2212460 RepID=UPI0025F1F338|nr:hypothetical protein [Propionivibrio sp.]MBK8892625.1 hypothetical protein [Propionivibrio sp.]